MAAGSRNAISAGEFLTVRPSLPSVIPTPFADPTSPITASSDCPEDRSAHLFGANEPPRTYGADDELTIPGQLEDFSVKVGRFLE